MLSSSFLSLIQPSVLYSLTRIFSPNHLPNPPIKDQRSPETYAFTFNQRKRKKT